MMKLLVILALASPAFSETYLAPEIPWDKLDVNQWWGTDESRNNQDKTIRPATIVWDDAMITDLKNRLKNYRALNPPLTNTNFTYGFNTDQMPFWASYWADSYDFKAREKYLNSLPQYVVNVQGLDMHFIWYKPANPKGKKVLPLLILHGWSGSIRELYDAIPLLAGDYDNRDYVLEVVAPCLPGFGYSQATLRTGLGDAQMAIVLRNLMQTIGLPQFYLQGGDWGGLIGAIMATLFPNDVLGFHTNFAVVPTLQAVGLQLVGAMNPAFLVDAEYRDRMYPIDTVFFGLLQGTGYFHEQATKPDTIGAVLTDSPVGLLAYLLEKFSSAVNATNINRPDGGLHNTFTPEQLLDNLMFYWAPKSITTSMRIYAESTTRKQLNMSLAELRTPVPTCVLQAKKEMIYQSPLVLSLRFVNLLNATVLDFGGHWLAFQFPKEFTENVLDGIDRFIVWRKNNDIFETS